MRSWMIVASAVLVSACGGAPTTPATPPFTGHWVGTYVVRQCVPVGGPSCTYQANQLYSIDLSLTQTGSDVVGNLTIMPPGRAWEIPVTGTASQNALAITGKKFGVPNLVSETTLRLTRWTASVDDRSRWQGTFGFAWESRFGPGSMRVGEFWTETYDAELVSLVPDL